MPVVFDETRGIVRSNVDGVQSAEDALAYMEALRRQAAVARLRVGRVLHLCDGRGAAVQPATIAGLYASYEMPDAIQVDKVATILSSALLKMQTQRVYSGENMPPMAIFSDSDEALAWLLAEEPRDR